MVIIFQHFVGGQPTKEYPCPFSADPYAGKRVERFRKAPTKRAAPTSSESFPSKLCKVDYNSDLTILQDDSAENSLSEIRTNHTEQETRAESGNNEGEQDTHVPSLNTNPEDSEYDVECNVCHNKPVLTPKQRKGLRRKDFISMTEENDKSCFQFTGVPSVSLLKRIFSWLKPATKKLKLWNGKKKLCNTGKFGGRKRKALSLYEEYILTLVRIRRGYDVVILAYQFGVTTSQVVRVVTSWINFLAKCFKPLIKWPTTETVKGNLPSTFKDFPRTKVIIDCTEIYVEKAFRPSAQRSTWSSYKHNNTFK